MLLNLIDILRIVIVCFGIFWGYTIGFNNGYDPVAQLHVTIPVVIVAIAGFSGLEGLLFGAKTAENKGFKTDGNYQRQSAIALLSYAAVALVVYFCKWGIKAELTIFFAFIFFFIFSGINHAVDAFRNKNYKWQNINRPFITFFLTAALIYPIIKVIQDL